MKNKWLSFLADGMLSGIMLTIGGIVCLSCENRYVGAFLFSLGLFSIVVFKYGLYTGKVGYIVQKDMAYVGETFFTLFANGIGAFLAAMLYRNTRFLGAEGGVIEKSVMNMTAKINDSFLSSFILAIFCGVLMFAAVEGFRKCNDAGNFIGGVFGVVMPVFVFIICGFNHCVADLAYYFLAGCPLPKQAWLYFIAAILGNAVGGILVPLFKKISNNPL